jgi:hypothetical protein
MAALVPHVHKLATARARAIGGTELTTLLAGVTALLRDNLETPTGEDHHGGPK